MVPTREIIHNYKIIYGEIVPCNVIVKSNVFSAKEKYNIKFTFNKIKNNDTCSTYTVNTNQHKKIIYFKVSGKKYSIHVWKNDIDDDESYCLKKYVGDEWENVFHCNNSNRFPAKYINIQGYLIPEHKCWSILNSDESEAINKYLYSNNIPEYTVIPFSSIKQYYSVEYDKAKLKDN